MANTFGYGLIENYIQIIELYKLFEIMQSSVN